MSKPKSPIPRRKLLKQMAWGALSSCFTATWKQRFVKTKSTRSRCVQLAIASARRSPTRNAIRYLAQNVEHGILTPLTYAYRDGILRRTGAADLTEAEAAVLSSMGRL